MTSVARARKMAGMKPTEPATPAARVRASEARKIAAGGRRMPGGVMPADAAEALAVLEADAYGDSSAGCIYRAIIDAADRIRKAKGKA